MTAPRPWLGIHAADWSNGSDAPQFKRRSRMPGKLTLAQILEVVTGGGRLPLKFTAFDGSTAGSDEATLGLKLLNPRGLTYLVTAPGELGLARAYVSGDLEALGVHPGDPVDIRIDTFPHRVFKGHVESIQAGSGTAFSLLPAENATGNYVKIVQRVPVKIVFDVPPDVLLGPGMSVVPTVHTK